MAIYHLHAATINRSRGQNAVASAAYRQRADLTDQNTGERFRYGKMADHRETFMVYPDGTDPEDKYDSAKLWSKAEAANTRKNAVTAREYEFSLPRELDDRSQKFLALDFALGLARRGMACQASIHDGAGENPHAHIMGTNGIFNDGEIGKPNREWSQKPFLKELRKEWELKLNKMLKLHNLPEVSSESFKTRGMDRPPQIHEGPTARKMEAEGRYSVKAHYNSKLIDIQLNQDIQIIQREEGSKVLEEFHAAERRRYYENLGVDPDSLTVTKPEVEKDDDYGY